MLEIEVKFHVPDLPAVARRVEAAGGSLERLRVLEHNVWFDDAAGSLGPRGIVLRLRRDERVRLTLKAPVPAAGVTGPAREMKVREEIEVEVGDAGRMRRLLEQLGYRAGFVYEKYRTTYRLGSCVVTLDELPIGSFVEIEGPAEEVRAQSEALGFDWPARLVDSYAVLFGRVCARLGLAGRDMTFAALAGVDVPPDAFR